MGKKYTILYVDDEPQNLNAFRAVFRRFFNVLLANNGPEALEVLEQKAVDLVLSDQRMPSMTGIELCEHLMQAKHAAARLIVTGYSELEPIQEAIQNGKIRNCIMKPWKTQELKTMIEEAIAAE